MQKKQEGYKKTEKWWLFFTVLFYALYNIPGIPEYGDKKSMLIHGALTIIPLWITCYVGMYKINKQRKLRKTTVHNAGAQGAKEESLC